MVRATIQKKQDPDWVESSVESVGGVSVALHYVGHCDVVLGVLGDICDLSFIPTVSEAI